jgi:hypothetical protein
MTAARNPAPRLPPLSLSRIGGTCAAQRERAWRRGFVAGFASGLIGTIVGVLWGNAIIGLFWAL